MKTLDFGNGTDRKPGTINADIKMNKGIDFLYDGIDLPVKSGVIDLIYSEQIMEHCMYIVEYYRECARILKPDGLVKMNFPHKFVPYDSHTRRWFLHWLPQWLWDKLWDRPGYINWKSRGYHRKRAEEHFKITDVADKVKVDFSTYRGPKRLRKIAEYLPFLKYFRQVHWELTKTEEKQDDKQSDHSR